MCPDTSALSAYFDGEISDFDSGVLEAHLRSCPACRATLDLFELQRKTLLADEPVISRDRDRLNEFWDYVGRSRVQHLGGPRRLSVPIPVAAAAILAFAVVSIMNFIPGRDSRVPDVVVFEAAPQAPTVVSLTITPGELDEFFAALEGAQSFSEQSIHALPADFPVVRLGDPQMVRPAGFERAP